MEHRATRNLLCAHQLGAFRAGKTAFLGCKAPIGKIPIEAWIREPHSAKAHKIANALL